MGSEDFGRLAVGASDGDPQAVSQQAHLFSIDFEASSLGIASYPIEVGICRWVAPESALEGWSTLIRPPESWKTPGSWSPDSEQVHGIREEELEEGLAPTDAIKTLNSMIGSHPAFCDGGTYDLNWARMLARASRVSATFKIGDFDMITARCDQVGYMRLARWLDRSAIPHRARGDAERLMKALAHGFGLKVGDSIDVPLPQLEV